MPTPHSLKSLLIRLTIGTMAVLAIGFTIYNRLAPNNPNDVTALPTPTPSDQVIVETAAMSLEPTLLPEIGSTSSPRSRSQTSLPQTQLSPDHGKPKLNIKTSAEARANLANVTASASASTDSNSATAQASAGGASAWASAR